MSAEPGSSPMPTAYPRGVMTVRRDIILITGLILLLLLPFLGKAFHIDDPLFIRTARHILDSPADPYGFSVNWFGIEAPMWQTMRNPPLASYYLALAGAVSGWSEVSLHSWFLLPAILCGLGIYAVAREWCSHPLLATSLSVLTPVFLVSASTLMCDVLMLAFWVWALAFWIRGVDHADTRSYLLASGCMAACVLTKFTGA